MAIGSPDRAARLEQLRTFARVQVRAGFSADDVIRAEVYDAVRAEVKDPGEAHAMTDSFIAEAVRDLDDEASRWQGATEFDELQAAFADLENRDVVVLQACDDHWAANQVLQERAAAGRRPLGIAYFTHPDVWHAVEHHMLELNVWHGSSANVAEGDELLDLVRDTLGAHGLPALFDEGRIEVTVQWQRRPGVRLR